MEDYRCFHGMNGQISFLGVFSKKKDAPPKKNGKRCRTELIISRYGAVKGFNGDQSRSALSRTRDRYPPAPPVQKQPENNSTTRKGISNMKNSFFLTKDDFDDDFFAMDFPEFDSELSAGPFSFKSHSKGSDGNGAVIGGVLAGGAVAIGAVAVVLILLGKNK